MNPTNCLVLEDSVVGIKAAQAAGMYPVFYAPHGSTQDIEGVPTISKLVDLLQLVA